MAALPKEPRCAQCAGALVEENLSLPFRVLAAALALVAAALALAPSGAGRWGISYAGAAACVVLAIVLMRSRRCWHCLGCGARFRRQSPPRSQGGR